MSTNVTSPFGCGSPMPGQSAVVTLDVATVDGAAAVTTVVRAGRGAASGVSAGSQPATNSGSSAHPAPTRAHRPPRFTGASYGAASRELRPAPSLPDDPWRALVRDHQRQWAVAPTTRGRGARLRRRPGGADAAQRRPGSQLARRR